MSPIEVQLVECGGTSEMYSEALQLTNSSEFPHDAPRTEDLSSTWRAIDAYSMAIYVVTCILGVSGNGLVNWSIGFKLKRTSYTICLLSLAMADFTFSVLLPLSFSELALDSHWSFGWLPCKLNDGALVRCLHVSIFTLATISVDRCVSVKLVPLDDQTLCCPDYLLKGEWAALNTTDYGGEDCQQVIEWAKNLAYARYRAVAITYFLGGFLLPFLVIAASYTFIGLELRWGRLVPSSGKSFRVMAAVILDFLLC
uniref:chemerin-like receptor 1 n=1 Tax=Pristiophorus japonicus TaxID=55135 RepID=UPI00398F6CB3